MFTNDRVETFLQQAKALLPDASITADIEKNLKVLAQSTFSKMDMVSRDEFEAQKAVLQRTREKLDQLEQQLAELSNK